MVQLIVKRLNNSALLPEWGLIELQGDVKHRYDVPLNDLHLGDLHFTKEGTPIILIGHHVLYGKIADLEKPLLVTQRVREWTDGSHNTSFHIQAAITKKDAAAEMSSQKVAAVLPAAGSGLRMGLSAEGPKQLMRVHGRSILCHTIQSMWKVPRVELIIVVTSETLFERVQQDVNTLVHFNASQPGQEDSILNFKNRPIAVEVICRPADRVDSRHSSIAFAVEYLSGKDFQLVIVHDAVRPIVPLPLMEELLLAAEQNGAAGPWVPLVSTVLRIDANGQIEDTLPRYPDEQGRLHVNSEMPQVFKYPLLAKAYSLCDAHQLIHGTECLELVRKYCGIRAKMIQGDPDLLWKVTLPRDILLAETLMKNIK